MSPGFHVIAKPRGPKCNLACGYCYYLPSERLYEGETTFRMSDEVLEQFVRQYTEAHENSDVMFSWQGGEPTLMGLEFFHRVLELQRVYSKPGVRVANALQTNGLLIDSAWCEFLRDHNFLVGLSLDGPAELHNAFRVGKDGRPTFDFAYRALTLLRRYGVEFNVLCVVNAVNARHPLRVYRFFRTEGVRHVQFIPAVQQSGTGVTAWTVPSGAWGGFLCDIFDEWVARDVGRVHMQQFELALEAWCGLEPSLCAHARTCGRALAVEHNGDVFACDHYVNAAHRLGNLTHDRLADLVDSPRQQRFGRDKADRLPRACHDCSVLFACNGGCPKDRFVLTSDGEDGLNYLCEGYRTFFDHAGPPLATMAQLLRQGGPAAAIMADPILRSRPVAPGRNSACPCGSGKKYKLCCGRRNSPC